MNLKLVDQYYKSPEYLTKLRARAEQINNCAEDELHRERMIMNVWAVDPCEFIETFLFIQLPNYQNAIKPFFLFPYQRDIIMKLLESENDKNEHTILIDKPREMGVTWIVAAYYYWRWLFTPNWSGFILSRTETEVDSGNNDASGSIFGKIRWMIQRTPRYMLPEGFAPKGKKGNSTDMNLKLVNPNLQSSITGSSTNSSAGRSRRYSLTWIDEVFYVEHFMEINRSLESVSRVKIYTSSAKAGRKFERFKDMVAEKDDYIHLEWNDHPWKDEEWFKELERKAEFDPEIMREAVAGYAIDKASQYYPQVSESKILPVAYDPRRPIYMSIDIGRGDLTVLIWWQYTGSSYNILECYSSKNKEIDWYVPFMNPETSFNPDRYPTTSQRDLLSKIKTWKKPTAWFGEQAHFAKSMSSNKSCADVLATYGIRLRCNNYAIKYEPRRKATAMVLPMTTFNENSDYVMELYDSIVNSRYANTVAPTSPDTVLKPVHDDEIADYRAAFENGCVNLPQVLRLQRDEVRDDRSKDLTNNLMRYFSH